MDNVAPVGILNSDKIDKLIMPLFFMIKLPPDSISMVAFSMEPPSIINVLPLLLHHPFLPILYIHSLGGLACKATALKGEKNVE